MNLSDGISRVLVLADLSWRPDDNEMKNMSFDDYERDKRLEARWGMTKAVDEFCKENKINLVLDTKEYLKLPFIIKK